MKVAEMQTENARSLGKAQIESQTATAQQQLQAMAENTKAQVRATVGTAHQQVVLDTFREHVAAILDAMHDAKDAQQRVEADAEFKKKFKAVKSQLMMLVLSAPSGNHPKEFVDEVNALVAVINSQPPGQKWSDEVDATFDKQFGKLIVAALNLGQAERKAIALPQ